MIGSELDAMTDAVALKTVTPILIGQGMVVLVVLVTALIVVVLIKQMLAKWLAKVETLLWMQEQHYMKNQQQKAMTLSKIQEILDKQQKVKEKVDTVPQETASLVAEEAVKVATERLSTGDSHHP